jgi:hypothetical protein
VLALITAAQIHDQVLLNYIFCMTEFDDDLVVAPGCMHGETSSGLGGDDPDLVVIPAAAVDVERRRGRAVVAPKLVGFFRAVLVVVSSHVSLAKELRFGKFNPRSEDLCRGIATCKWQVDPSGADFARVTYTVDNFVNFTRPIPYESWGLTERVFSMCEHSASLRGAMDTGSWDLCVETGSGLGDEIHQLLVTLEEFDGLTSKSSGSRLVEPCLLREVDIACAQGVSLAKLVPDNPTRYAIVRFRGPHADKTSRTLRDEIVLELPAALKRKMDEKMHDNSGVAGLAKLEKKIDPIRMLNAVAFGRHLRGAKHFQSALEDAHLYEHGADSDGEGAAFRNTSRDPCRSTLDRARAKLDVVACLLDRREFQGLMHDGSIVGICLFSDSSPVTGTELQGMVMDIVKRVDCSGGADRGNCELVALLGLLTNTRTIKVGPIYVFTNEPTRISFYITNRFCDFLFFNFQTIH